MESSFVTCSQISNDAIASVHLNIHMQATSYGQTFHDSVSAYQCMQWLFHGDSQPADLFILA